MFLRRFPSIRTDVVGLLDEWAARFFEELDYVREGNNGILFAQQMAKDLPQVLPPSHIPLSPCNTLCFFLCQSGCPITYKQEHMSTLELSV